MKRRAATPPPAQPGRSNYITPEGAERIRDEIRHLWEVERPRITQEVSEAAAQGDRSENAEYIYGKKRLREIDRRLHYLSGRLDTVTVVPPRSVNDGRIFFGAYVRLRNESGGTVDYQIVGPDEVDIDTAKISIDSPMGRALIRHEVGEEIVVKRPMGDATYTILEVRYEPFVKE